MDETTEKFELPPGCSLEFTGPAGKPIKVMSIDELKKVTREERARAMSEKRQALRDECKEKVAKLSDVVEGVYHAMIDDKCICECKEVHEQFGFFVNNILLPHALPGFKCIIEPSVEKTYDLEGVPAGTRIRGVRLVFVTESEYADYWKSRRQVAADLRRKCLASKSDLRKIGDAITPAPRKIDPAIIIPITQLLLNKNSTQGEVAVAINSILKFISDEYGDLIGGESIVSTDTIQKTIDVLNVIIKFVNNKFGKNIKPIKTSDKLLRRINVCISVIKLLKAVKQHKKTGAKKSKKTK